MIINCDKNHESFTIRGLLCDIDNWMPILQMKKLRLKEVKPQQSLELVSSNYMEKQMKANMLCHYKINKIAQVLESDYNLLLKVFFGITK